MWVVILIGLALEGVAIALILDEEGGFALIASLFSAAVIKFAFYGGRIKVSFWLLLVVLEAIPWIILAIKMAAEKNEREREDQLREKAENEARRRREKEQAEDENRIEAHMPIIRASSKYSTFSKFFLQNLSEISQIRVDNGRLTVHFYVGGIRYVPDYRQGIMVIDPSQPNATRSFFGQADDERAWTVFEAEALARLIDEAVKPTGNFSLGHKAMGHREYNRIAPATPVIAKTPY